MTIQESTLMAPIFAGSDEEIASATQSWASMVSTFSYNSSMSAENKKAFFMALVSYATGKITEIDNVTTPPVVATSAPTFAATPAVCEPATAEPEIVVSYAEKKEVNPMLKRMRELAGIAHPDNRV
jgi:hypothetical protein